MTNAIKPRVSCGHPESSKAALQIMAQGGNAYDAIIAAGFTSAIAEQALTSLGGGGFLLAHTCDRDKILFDFFSDTPGKGLSPNQLEPHFFPVTIQFSGSDQDFNIGLGSIAVPGNLKGFLHVHKKLGTLPLKEILQPAIHAARFGVKVNTRQSQFMQLLYPIMTLTETGRKLFMPHGQYLSEGMTSKNSEMARFLEQLPDNMGEEFYCGRYAKQIVTDMEKGQGLLTREDLAGYRVLERNPLELSYRGNILLTNPPPSFGGTLIGITLKLLEEIDLSSYSWGSKEHISALSFILQEVDNHRNTTIFSPENAESSMLPSATERIRQFSRGTTHISVSDGFGNHASMTTSNGEGSGYIAPETGIMLNNMMGEDDLHPEGFHSSAPGLRVASMMSPSILLNEERVELVLGSGGSKRIRTAIPQVLSNVMDFHLPLQDAIQRPRIHWDGTTLQVEPGYPLETIMALKDQLPLNIWQECNVYFGGVHAIHKAYPAGDPRRGGDAQVGKQGSFLAKENQNKATGVHAQFFKP